MSFQSDYPTDHCYPRCTYMVRDLNDNQVLDLLDTWKRHDVEEALTRKMVESKVGGDSDRRIRHFWLNKLYVKLGMIGNKEFGLYNHDGTMHFVHLFERYGV